MIVVGMGKLGGGELNYSSDIDLLFLAQSEPDEYLKLAERLIDALAGVTAEGFCTGWICVCVRGGAWERWSRRWMGMWAISKSTLALGKTSLAQSARDRRRPRWGETFLRRVRPNCLSRLPKACAKMFSL